MALMKLKDLPRKGRILGIDWGLRRTGLAVSDESQEFVFPRGVALSPVREECPQLVPRSLGEGESGRGEGWSSNIFTPPSRLPPSPRLRGTSRRQPPLRGGARDSQFCGGDTLPGSRGALPGEILEIIASENIAGIVVGLPLYSDGTDSGVTRKVREFAANLASVVSPPVAFMEENLTSVEAAERLKEKKGRGKKSSLDSESAQVILENAIAMLKRIKNV